ncbi:MAG: hypothetical protein J6D29_05110 [Solobacterium sp.]|nr:hypothetical protein [Solobacterium sp.]
MKQMKKVFRCLLGVGLVVSALTFMGCSSKQDEVVGKWTLSKVMASEPGQALQEKTKEENQSLFGEGETYYSLNADQTAVQTMADGTGAQVDYSGKWTKESDGSYRVEMDSLEAEVFTYNKSEDTLVREIKNDSADAQYAVIQFIYTRVK